MSGVRESSLGFSDTEQPSPQVLPLQDEEQRRIERAFHEATSLELTVLRHVVARITHEFNNTLTVIMGYTDIALQKRLLSETNCDDLIRIKKASERAASLVRHLLTFSELGLEPADPEIAWRNA